ncbi:MAG: ribonuclease III, partial [Acidobacteria bacterium]
QSDIEAKVVRGLLEAHGIRSIVSSDIPQSVFPVSIDALGEVRISVREEDADDALRLISSHRVELDTERVVPFRDAFQGLERKIGHRFKSKDLLERALTHSSLSNEEGAAWADNESLEFLGDAVLGFLVADTLFRAFPEEDEGHKSKTKSMLVSTPTLARLAARLDLGAHLMLGRGEEKTGGRRKQALLADAFEALIAAIYLDGGIEAARRFVAAEFQDLLEEVTTPGYRGRDYKSALQEMVQAQGQPLPVYRVTSETGPPHRLLFEVEVVLRDVVVATGRGQSKKEAEQEAARLAIERLGENS